MTVDELGRFFDAIDDYRDRLIMRVIYETGCRVGEFVRIRLGDVAFARGQVRFPAENTKTRRTRVSHLPEGLVNELRAYLRAQGRMARHSDQCRRLQEFLFHPGIDARFRFSENRIRQIFMRYVGRAGLDRVYGADFRGRRLHELTVHSLRHSHIMHYIHVHRLPIPIVQKQVGHTSLKTTGVYLRPSDEHVGQAYRQVRHHWASMTNQPQGLSSDVPLSLHNDTDHTGPPAKHRTA
jgi:integrase/recombinase XerD